MVTELNNDEQMTKNVNQASAISKVTPVKTVVEKQGLPENGNGLPRTVEDNRSARPANEVDPGRLDDAVRGLNEHVQTVQRELQFTVDKDSGHTVIKVMDMETQEVIRQIPSEEALSVARQLSEGAELELFSSYT